jgi:hypothetical protein
MRKVLDDALALRTMIELPGLDDWQRDVLRSVAGRLVAESDRERKYAALQEIGESTARYLAEMVAALECDYDRLEELSLKRSGDMDDDEKAELAALKACAGACECESEDDARQRIQEDPLSIEVSGTWVPGETPTADRAIILLGTGGPATRIVCELDHDREPCRARLEVQDWFQPWTEYRGDAISEEALLKYCACFYFGEG